MKKPNWDIIFTPEEAKRRYDLCLIAIEKLLGLNEPNVKDMLAIASKRTWDEYVYTVNLIESAKYYLKFFQKNDLDFLYLLYSKDLDLYKIGITNDIEVRIKSIKTEMKIKHLDVIFLIPELSHYEKILHNKFNHLNVPVKRKRNHREWFNYSDEIIKEFKQLQNG
jgi:hypothetical protein